MLCALASALACASCGGGGRTPPASVPAQATVPTVASVSKLTPLPPPLVPVRAPAPPPNHIPTWAYVDSCDGVGRRQTGLVRQWVTYAETKCAEVHPIAPMICRAHGISYCTSISYIDPNLDWSEASLGLLVPRCIRQPNRACANESWFVHDARTGRRLTWTAPSLGSAYLLNGANPSYDAFVARYARRALAAFDGLMVDNVSASTAEQLYGSGDPVYTTSAELRSNAAVQQAHVRLAEELGPSFLQIDNGINMNPYTLPSFALLNHPKTVVGLVAESFPELTTGLASWYSTGLDDIAYLDDTPSLARNFIVLLGYNLVGSATARRVQEATVMLGFEPGKIVDWADLAMTKPGLAVWPEEGLYFEQPLESMQEPSGPRCLNGLGGPCAHGHADLRVALGAGRVEQAGGAGVYRREFGRCFLRSVPIGGCAAIMNDTNRTVTISGSWLRQRYRYEMTFDGGYVQTGGRLNVAGAAFTPGVTTIAPGDAALLSQ